MAQESEFLATGSFQTALPTQLIPRAAAGNGIHRPGKMSNDHGSASHVTFVSKNLLERDRTSLFDTMLDVAFISIFSYELIILYIFVNCVTHVYDWPHDSLYVNIYP